MHKPRHIRYDDAGEHTSIVHRYLQNPFTGTSYFIATAKRSRDGLKWNLVVERCDPAEATDPLPLYWNKRLRSTPHLPPSDHSLTARLTTPPTRPYTPR